MWAGGECWIIGGGPSMPRQFNIPEDVIQKVMRRELEPNAYSPYLEPLHSRHIIGINNVYQIGNWIDILFFGDCPWYLVHRLKISNFPGLKVTCCNRFENKRKDGGDGLKYLAKNKEKREGITTDKTMLSFNCNSGSAGINLAVHLGVKRIILLGFDMKIDSRNITHWHGSHGELNKKIKRDPYPRHMRGFPLIKQEADSLGVEIINASPESAIKEFEKVNVGDLL